MHHRNRLTSCTAVMVLSFLIAATGPAAGQVFLEDGGGVSLAPLVDFSESREEFLEGGGGVRTAPDIYVTDEREEFLEDGGGIRTAPDIYSTNEREEFLEDGGSIRLKPNFDVLTVRGRNRAWRPLESPSLARRSNASITTFTSAASDSRSVPSAVLTPPRYHGDVEGPKIINVARARLDRRPYPASGIEIIETGGAKIIRIAPGYDRRAAAKAIDAPAVRKARAGEPWTPAWLSRCTRAHPSFDPNFGTYVDANGNSRFCTGG